MYYKLGYVNKFVKAKVIVSFSHITRKNSLVDTSRSPIEKEIHYSIFLKRALITEIIHFA